MISFKSCNFDCFVYGIKCVVRGRWKHCKWEGGHDALKELSQVADLTNAAVYIEVWGLAAVGYGYGGTRGRAQGNFAMLSFLYYKNSAL